MSEKAPQLQVENLDQVTDLGVRVSANGRPLRENGKAMSYSNAEAIIANQDFIRENLPGTPSSTETGLIADNIELAVGDLVRFPNPDKSSDGSLTEWKIKSIAKDGEGVLLEDADGKEHVRSMDGLKNDLREGPMPATEAEKIAAEGDPKKNAARWYTHVRPFGEAPDETNIAEGATEDEATRLANRDHAERLNQREGKENPTQDDIDYYRWLKENSGKAAAETETPNGDDGEGGDDDTQEVPEVVNPELDKQLVDALGNARSNYALESAKAQRTHLGRLLLNSEKGVGKWLRKLPGMDKLIDKHNTKANQPLAEAKAQYEEILKAAGVKAKEMLENAGVSPEDIKALTLTALCEEANNLVAATAESSVTLAGSKRSRLAEFWVRNTAHDPETKKRLGTVKKVAVLGLTAAAIGTGVGLVGLGAWAGSIAGGAAAGAMARRVAHKQAAAPIHKGGSAPLAALKFNQRSNAMESRLGSTSGQRELAAEDITAVQEHFTTKEIQDNRRRMKAAVAVGALAGGLGAQLGGALKNVGQEAASRGGKKAGAEAGKNAAGNNANLPKWNQEQWDNFDRMMKWYHQQKAANPALSDKYLAEGFNRYLTSVS